MDAHEGPVVPAGRGAGRPDHDDEFDDGELELSDGELGARLRSLLDPSDDLPGRTSADVDRTLRGRSVLATGLELIGLGALTARTLLSDPAVRADRDREGT